MKKIYIIASILLILAVISVNLITTTEKTNDPSSLIPVPEKTNNTSNSTDLILPEKVGLYIQDSQNEDNLPELVLTVFAGNGCDEVGELKLSEEFKQNQSNIYTKGENVDILDVHIYGYEFEKADTSLEIVCPAVIQESRATINLSKYLTESQLRLNIFINDQINSFDLSFHEDVLFLDPIESLAVISWIPSENMPMKAQKIGFMTNPFLDHLAKVRLNGGYAHESNLSDQVRKYFNQSGFEPLDEKIQLNTPYNPLEEFIVYVDDKDRVPESFTLIGKINYHEVLAGDKTIDVGLVRTNSNPLFTRQ